MEKCLFILWSFEDLNYCLVWCDQDPNRQMLITIPPVVWTYSDTGMGLLIDGMYVVPPSSNVVVVDTSTFDTFQGEGGSIVYMVNVVITIVEMYNITSMVPNCVCKIPNINVLLLIIKLYFMTYLQVDIKNWKFWKTISAHIGSLISLSCNLICIYFGLGITPLSIWGNFTWFTDMHLQFHYNAIPHVGPPRKTTLVNIHLFVGSPTSQIFVISRAPSHLHSFLTLSSNLTSYPLAVPITFTRICSICQYSKHIPIWIDSPSNKLFKGNIQQHIYYPSHLWSFN